MSASSGLGPVSAVTVTGSSAIPQIGHEPGPGRRISGCIGHVHSVTSPRSPGCRRADRPPVIGLVVVPMIVCGESTVGVQVRLGAGLELRLAVPGAEVVRLPVVLGAVLTGGGVDVHAADGILHSARFVGGPHFWVAHAGMIPP